VLICVGSTKTGGKTLKSSEGLESFGGDVGGGELGGELPRTREEE